MKYLILILVFFVIFPAKIKAQIGLCNGAAPFCTGSTYTFPAPITSNIQPGIDLGCLGSAPNPVWYYLKVATSGPIQLHMNGALFWDDIDFACWGPFTSPTGGCIAQLTNNCTPGCLSNTNPGAVYPSGNMVDCSFDAQNAEDCLIPNAVAGEYYLILITNYGGFPTNIIFNQTNAGNPGAGSTDCSIVNPANCNISALTANPSACNSSNNTYSVTGSVTFTNAPTTGSLTITNSCGGTKTVVAPFTSPVSYSFTSISSNGGNCTINAAFSAAASCTRTATYTAPVACSSTPTCIINALTAIPSPCDITSNTYSVTGSVTFTNAPVTGSLIITNACGGSQTFVAPFNSPVSYSFTGISSSGGNCAINAAFSAAASCTRTATYTAPVACSSTPTCIINTLTANPSACDVTNNTYSVTGSVTFTNAPVTGSLIITNACGGSQTFLAPFNSPVSYSFTNLNSNGNTCNVTTVFSAAASCTIATNYIAPTLCATVPICNVILVTANPSPCDATNNTYSVTGTVSFTNAPATGSLIVADTSGISQSFVAPFTSSINYSLTNIVSDGLSHSVRAYFTNALSCFNTTYYNAPQACVSCIVTSANNSPICELEMLTLNSLSSNAASYSWSGPNGFSSSISTPSIPSISVQGSGIYTVTVVSINSAVCTATTNVVVQARPVLNYSLTIPQLPGDYIVSGTNHSTNTSFFYWLVDNKKIFSSDFNYDFGNGGNYQICLYTENTLGCVAAECQNIELKQDWGVYIPNSFSPNEDNINDLFSVYGYGITDVRMDIYDRWGSRIFSGHTINDGWNGSVEGSSQTAKSDVYTYKVRLKDINSKQHDYTGHVTLLK